MPILKHYKAALFLLGLLLLWEGATEVFEIPWFILPAPSQIILKIVAVYDRLAAHALVTLGEVLAGFALAVILGILIATVIVHSRFLAETLYPLLIISQVTPQVAIAPILVIWFGSGFLPKVLIAFLVAFFPIVVNTATGLLRVDEDLLDLMRGFQTSRMRIFRLVRLPNALPYIFAGMRISIALAVIGAVVGEFVAASEGLGYLIFTGMANLETPLTFAAVAVLAAMGIVLFGAVSSARRLALPWVRDSDEGSA